MMMEEEGLKVNKLYSDVDDLMKIDYLPPGFRFHPTDEEIITHYLKQKVLNSNFSAAAIGEADLNKSEPWDLPKKAKMGQGEKECYLFCQKDRKYPTGMRTNRATESGYWKATGKDKEIYTKGRTSSSSSNSVSASLIGMKKTLVFYRGRAPKGEKTNWIMHEYRLVDGYYHLPPNTPKDEWVVSRVFQKSTGGIKKMVIIGDGDGDDDLLLDCPNYSISNTRPHPPASIDDYCEDQFKGSNLNVTASNNKYIISNTGVHQSSRLHQLIDQNTYLHPPSNNYYNYPTTSTNLVPLQNHPSFPFQSPPIIPAYQQQNTCNITNFTVEQLSSSNQTMAVSLASQDTGLSTDMNTTADISSKHDIIRGRSNRSYEIEAAAPSSMPDYGCIWDDY